MKRILGIDPGTKRLGFGIIDVEKDKIYLVDGGTVEVNSTGRNDRLKELYNFTRQLLKKFDPDVVVIEESFYGNNVKTLIRLAEVRASVIVAAGEESIEVEEYSPREIKLAITGDGKASKERVAFMVSSLLNIRRPEELDFSDAIATALCSALRKRI